MELLDQCRCGSDRCVGTTESVVDGGTGRDVDGVEQFHEEQACSAVEGEFEVQVGEPPCRAASSVKRCRIWRGRIERADAGGQTMIR